MKEKLHDLLSQFMGTARAEEADAKWKIGLVLGKTQNQDAWIIGDGVDVMLSRSIRRVDRPWTNFLAYYSGLQTHSFVYQTNFGGRIVPRKKKHPAEAGRSTSSKTQRGGETLC